MIRMLDRGLDYYGMQEVPGIEHNPVILRFFELMGKAWVQDDETAWCSAFINYLAIVEGYEHSGELHAKSWLNYGIDIFEPVRGCLVVLWRIRPDAWQGHVGLYITHTKDHVYIFGGNQNNRVDISPYPIQRVESFRILKPTK